MCMLFIKNEGLVLPNEYFDSLQHHNADGVSIYHFKSKKTFKFLDYDLAQKALEKFKDDKCIVHFRFGTSGQNGYDQLHGWEILNNEYVFFHNGVLSTFSGDKEKGLSDTQQLINMIEEMKDTLTINDIVKYLETFEKSSRFLIVKKSDNSVIIPNCAKWANVIKIDGIDLQFSNNYAIDFYLQQDDGHLQPKPKYSKYDMWDDYHDDLYDDYGNCQRDELNAEDELIYELDYIKHNGTLKELEQFITVNPDAAALYIRTYS